MVVVVVVFVFVLCAVCGCHGVTVRLVAYGCVGVCVRERVCWVLLVVWLLCVLCDCAGCVFVWLYGRVCDVG